jgi:Flp pilus assembly protein TadD
MKTKPRAAAADPPDPARARARRSAAWAAFAVLALLGVAPLVPSMSLWGVNVLRFAGPWGWVVWGMATAAALAALAGRFTGWLDGPGRGLDRSPALFAAGLAVVTAVVVLALPDRTFYTGDFLFRRGLNEIELQKSGLAPQLMPADRFLHLELAPAARDALGSTTVETDRWIAAIDAVLLALAAVLFVRALGARGAAGTALATALVFGGALSIFTGYGKSFVEMAVVVVALAACAIEVVERGRGWVPLALCAVLELALHRTGFVVLPAVVVAGAIGAARHGRRAGVRAQTIAAAVILVAGLAWLAPKAIAILRAYDVVHHEPGATAAAATAAGAAAAAPIGTLAALFAPLRLADLANAVLLLAPLVPAAIAALLARPAGGKGAVPLVLGTLALSYAGLAFASFPQQGLVRDFDVLVPNGVAWTCLAVAWLASTFEDRRGPQGALPVVVLALSLATGLAWLVHLHDTERGFARVRAIVAGPPERPAGERAANLDFVGAAMFRLLRYGAAADASRDATAAAPNPRYFIQWSVAARNAGRDEDARAALRQAVARNPKLPQAWMLLGALAGRAGDLAEADRAWQAALALSPNDPGIARNAARTREALRAAAARDSLRSRAAAR